MAHVKEHGRRTEKIKRLRNSVKRAESESWQC